METIVIERKIEVKISEISKPFGEEKYAVASYDYDVYSKLSEKEKIKINNDLVSEALTSINNQIEINSKFEIGDKVKAWRHTSQKYVEGIVLQKYWLESRIKIGDDWFYCINDKISKVL